MQKVLEALDYIDVSKLSYQQWINVGMALKNGGYQWYIWDNWSKNDIRYQEGLCQRKWDSFTGSDTPITVGTIYGLAKEFGYVGYDNFINWDDEIEYDGDSNLTAVEQLSVFISTLFKDDEYISYVTSDVYKDTEGKYMPAKGVFNRTAKELLTNLEKYPDDIGASVSDCKECGGWIRFNPVDSFGIKNENITRFSYALVECDDISKEKQYEEYLKHNLPIATLVDSGNKSLHAIVKVDAKDYQEYKERVSFLYEYLINNGVNIDRQNKNPSRLTRMPGVKRNGKIQKLIATNIGAASWDKWIDYLDNVNDELPAIIDFADVMDNLPELADELMQGVVRVGHKLLLSGASKSGKSFSLMEMAVDIVMGNKFLGRQMKQGSVLYLNLEIAQASCFKRFKEIFKAKRINDKPHGLHIWNLRGKALSLDKLVPKIIQRAKRGKYIAIIIDPIYKVITGDENNASEMALFCNQFDRICDETGASVIYAHHHSKGAQGNKVAMDRNSGSGVFSRDPDAIIDLIELEMDEQTKQFYGLKNSVSAWKAEFVTREFETPKPINLLFDYPLHSIDETGILDNFYPRGDVRNAFKNNENYSTSDSRFKQLEEGFEVANVDGKASIKAISEALDLSERTVRRYVKEFENYYQIKDKMIVKK